MARPIYPTVSTSDASRLVRLPRCQGTARRSLTQRTDDERYAIPCASPPTLPSMKQSGNAEDESKDARCRYRRLIIVKGESAGSHVVYCRSSASFE